MKDVELRYVGGHVEVYTEAGAFLFWKSWMPLDAFPEIPGSTGRELENTNVK